MKTIKAIVIFLLIFSVFGCAKKVVANISASRKAFILSQPHGWIELEIMDNEIPGRIMPDNLSEEEVAEWETSPPACYMVVFLNNERFLYEDIFPFGESPPYSVETGFRFPAPIGVFKIEISYYGCDVESNDDGLEPSFKTMTSEIDIMENLVSPVFIDGNSIQIDPARNDTVITIDDVYKRLEQIEKK